MHLPVRTTLALLLAALGLTFLGAGSAVAAADGDVAWSVRTASNHYGSDRQNYSYTLDPGGSLHDGLVVSNHGKEPIDLETLSV